MDLVIETPRPAGPGETIEGTRFYTAPGGKGGNQAVAAARLSKKDSKIEIIGKLGSDLFGNTMRQYLNSVRLETRFLREDKTTSSGIAQIFIDQFGENYVTAVYGTNAKCDGQQIEDARLALEDADVLLVQQEIPLGVTYETMKVAHDLGVMVILDPSPIREVPNKFYSFVDILTPNEIEASSISGVSVNDYNSAGTAARKIRQNGPATVIITMGELGAYVESNSQSEFLPGLKTDVVASVGAGDAFNGGLAVGIAEGKPLVDTLSLAMASGAFCVGGKGAQEAMGTRKDILNLLKKQRG